MTGGGDKEHKGSLNISNLKHYC